MHLIHNLNEYQVIPSVWVPDCLAITWTILYIYIYIYVHIIENHLVFRWRFVGIGLDDLDILTFYGIPAFQVAQRVRYRWGMMGRSAAWQSRAPIVANSDRLGLQLSNLGTADPKICAGLWTEMTSVGDPQVWRPLLVSAAFRTTFMAVAKMNT